MALREYLILRRPRSGRLEGRTLLIQAGEWVRSVRIGPLMQALAMAQARDILFGKSHREMRRLVVVAAAEHLAAPIQPGQCLAVGQRDVEPNDAGLALEAGIDQFE